MSMNTSLSSLFKQEEAEVSNNVWSHVKQPSDYYKSNTVQQNKP